MSDAMWPGVGDEDSDADALSAYWDRLARGNEPDGNLEWLERTARRLHALDDTPALGAAQRERIWHELLAHIDHGAGPPVANGHLAANGRVPDMQMVLSAPPRRASHAPPHWLLTQFATAAFVLLVVGLGYLVLGPGRSALHEPNTMPAIGAPDDVDSANGPQTLLELTVPAAMVPSGNSVRSCLSHITVPPHLIATWDAASAVCCPGTRLNYVLAGTYLIRPAGPVQVIRATGATETWDGGREVTLGAGDAVLIPSETPFEAENPTATPVELLQQILSYPAAFPRGTATLAGEVEHDYDMRDVRMRSEPMRLRLQRRTLAPDADLPMLPGILQMWIVYPTNPAGTPVTGSLAVRSDGSYHNFGAEENTIYTLSLEPAGVGSLTP